MDIWHVCLLVMASWNFYVAIRYAWKLGKEQRAHRDYRWETSFSEYRLACEENWSRIWMRRCFEERGRAIRYQRQIMAAVDREKARWDERDQLRKQNTALTDALCEHIREIEAMRATASDLDASYRNDNAHLREHNKSLEATNRQLRNGHGSQQ